MLTQLPFVGLCAPLPAGGGALAIPKWGDFVLLAGFNGSDGATSFVGEGLFPQTINRQHSSGTCEIDTAQSKFGGSSLLMATNDFANVSNTPSLEVGGRAYTAGCWVRFSTVNATVGFLGKHNNAGAGWLIDRASGDVRHRHGGTTLSAAWSPSTATWYFLMADRDAGGVLRLYVDGAMVAKEATPGNAGVSTSQLAFGRLPYTATGFHDGWIEEAFLIVGQALCGNDAGFVLPSAAFTRGLRYESTTSTSISSSAFASKGQIVDALTDATISGVGAYIGPSGAETYKMVVATLNTGTDLIASILGVSDSITISATGFHKFVFSAPMAITTGQRIAFIAVRTDGASDAPCRIAFPPLTGSTTSDFAHYGAVRYTSTNPTVGDTVLYGGVGSSRVVVGYE